MFAKIAAWICWWKGCAYENEWRQFWDGKDFSHREIVRTCRRCGWWSRYPPFVTPS